MYFIKIGEKYYGGEGDGCYKNSPQWSYKGWSGDLGIKANALSGMSIYLIVDTEEKACKLSKVSVAEIVAGILERQQGGYIKKADVCICSEKIRGMSQND